MYKCRVHGVIDWLFLRKGRGNVPCCIPAPTVPRQQRPRPPLSLCFVSVVASDDSARIYATHLVSFLWPCRRYLPSASRCEVITQVCSVTVPNVNMAPVAPSPLLNIEGFTATGDYARTIHLEGEDGMRAAILTRGCRVLDLRLHDSRSFVLPVSTLAEVEADESYINVAVGRTANRIEGGRFLLDGKEVVLQCNDNGQNQIHGGTVGWDKKLFAVRDKGPNYVELFLVSPDLDQGFPSSVEVSIRYELDGMGGFTVGLSTSNVGKEATVTNMTVCPTRASFFICTRDTFGICLFQDT